MSEQLYQAHFHLTGLTSQEYHDVLSNVTKIGKAISFGGGVDNIIEQRTTLIEKIETDLKSLGLDQEKRKKLIDDWKKIIW
jgi:hypothetical protein